MTIYAKFVVGFGGLVFNLAAFCKRSSVSFRHDLELRNGTGRQNKISLSSNLAQFYSRKIPGMKVAGKKNLFVLTLFRNA